MATVDPVPSPAAIPYRDSIASLYAIGHPWAKQALAYADAAKGPDGDYGQWHALAYAMTGQPKYATTAAERLLKALDVATPVRNTIRQNWLDQVILFGLIRPALNDDTVARFAAAFDRTCAFCWGIGFPENVGRWRFTDSDQTIGQVLGVLASDLATGSKWSDRVEFGQAVAAVRDYIRMSKGGAFIESSLYDPNTVALLLAGAHAIGPALTDQIPELAAWADEVATFTLASITPDGTDCYPWGDVDGGVRGIGSGTVLWRWLTLLYVLYGLTGRRDVWAAIELIEGVDEGKRPLKTWLPYGWRVMRLYRDPPAPLPPDGPPPVPPTVEERLTVLESQVAALIAGKPVPAVPVAATKAPPAKPVYLYTATGQGQVRYTRGGSFFGCHAPGSEWRGDHAVGYTFDLHAQLDGVWWLTHPIGYGLTAVSGAAQNGPLLAGLGSMWARGIVSVTETDTGVIVEAATSGSAYRPTYYQPPVPFVDSFRRRAEFDYAGRARVRDEFAGRDPLGAGMKSDRYAATDLARIKEAVGAGRLWEQRWHTLGVPLRTADGYRWSLPNGRTVTLTAPADIETDVVPAAQLFAANEFGKTELNGYVIRFSSAALACTMETAVEVS